MVIKGSKWPQAVVYQVYPWTYYEDAKRHPQKGNGSIRGIIEKLPYLRNDMGIDALWVTPFYASPMIDGGYDVANHTDVHPDLGTIHDVDELIKNAHELDMKLIFDIVVNHTSDQHEWFQKSRKKEGGYDDWYIWHPGHKDEQGNPQPPNNWSSVRSKPLKKARERGEMPQLKEDEWTPYVSAWQWDDERGEFYMRTFAKEQPDLNWSNPKVREAVKDIIRFWLDRGVDAFRIDAVNFIGKNPELTDEQINTAYNETDFDNPYDQLLRYNSCNFPDTLHKYVWEITEVLRDEKYENKDLYFILEAYMGEAELRDLNEIAPDVASTFNFGAMKLGWNATIRKVQMDSYYEKLPSDAIGNQVNGNHDNPRLATRLGDAPARAAALMNFFLPGMHYVYNGEELGLHDASVPPERIKDRDAFRDDARTPMLWDDKLPNAGFSSADPANLWLPINEADLGLAFSRQLVNAQSTLSLYVAAIRLGHELECFKSGQYVPLKTDNDQILAYGRNYGEDEAVIVVNFSPYVQHATLIGNDFAAAKTVLSSVDVTQNPRDINLESGIHMKPNEAVVIIPNRVPFALWK